MPPARDGSEFIGVLQPTQPARRAVDESGFRLHHRFQRDKAFDDKLVLACRTEASA
jgi:hypothetical protein